MPLPHLQTMINQVLWSFPDVTFIALPYPPPISRILGTVDGLLYTNTNQNAVAVATLVATTMANNAAAQSFLTCINDNYPVGVNPMAHFVGSILVYPIELTNSGGSTRTAWNITADPPTTNVQHQATWNDIFNATDFPTTMHYVGKVVKPPLF
jgi:hypothetical protein